MTVLKTNCNLILLLAADLFLLLTGCVVDHKKQLEAAPNRHGTIEKFSPYSFYLTDSLESRYPYVKFTVIDSDGTYQVNWGTEKESWSDNMVKLTGGLGYDMPPTLQ